MSPIRWPSRWLFSRLGTPYRLVHVKNRQHLYRIIIAIGLPTTNTNEMADCKITTDNKLLHLPAASIALFDWHAFRAWKVICKSHLLCRTIVQSLRIMIEQHQPSAFIRMASRNNEDAWINAALDYWSIIIQHRNKDLSPCYYWKLSPLELQWPYNWRPIRLNRCSSDV